MIYLVTAVHLLKTEGRCSHLYNVVPIYTHMRTCRSHILHLAVCLLNAREYYPPVYTQTRIRFHPHTNQDGKLTNSDRAVPIYLDSCTSTQRLVKCPYTKYRLRDMIKGSSYIYNVCQFQKNRKWTGQHITQLSIKHGHDPIYSLPRSERGDRLLSRTAVPSLRLIPNMRPTVIKDHFHYIIKFHADQSSVLYVGQPFKPKTTPVSFQIWRW